jgi:hypothetical protein
VINGQQFVASMSNGDVKIVDCPNANGDDNGKMSTIAAYPHVHKFIYCNLFQLIFLIFRQSASRAICVLNDEIFSGSDSGSIVRIHPSGRSSNAIRPFAEDLMGF